MTDPATPPSPQAPKQGFVQRALGAIETLGNKLPDPAVLFAILMVVVWVISAAMAGTEFKVPTSTGEKSQVIVDQLFDGGLLNFLSNMVKNFTGFGPVGVVLVAMLGVGVAEKSGFINAALKFLLQITPQILLSPMLLLVAIASHTAADAGYVLVIPLGGIIFHAAGRHPLAGIACAFAGVSGGFGANFFVSAIDPLLQGLTEPAAQIVDATKEVGVLCNYYFAASSSLVVMGVGWFLTDKVIEPRLANTPLDGELAVSGEQQTDDETPTTDLSPAEQRGLWAGLAVSLVGLGVLVMLMLPADSPLRDPSTGSLTSVQAPIMKIIVPLIFLLFLLPGITHGYVSGTFKNHRDVIKGMTEAMSGMGYYLAMMFFCAQFTTAFAQSNLGGYIAVNGSNALQAMGLPGAVTLAGIILLTAFVNLLVGSASGKWALLAPIFVPVLMNLGYSPELTQAAYRVGDSCTNIITPLMPYFPLVVAFCQRWVKGTGIGTLTSMMLPYSVTMLVVWTLYLVIYWQLGLSLGPGAEYTWAPK